jgi:DNA helicase MCM8
MVATQVASELEHGDKAFLKELVDKSKQPHSLVPPALLRKYICYAQKYVHPRLSPEAAAALKEFYLDIRQSRHSANDMFPVTTRQLESAIRLSEARAKAELRNTVTKQDAEDVVAIM